MICSMWLGVKATHQKPRRFRLEHWAIVNDSSLYQDVARVSKNYRRRANCHRQEISTLDRIRAAYFVFDFSATRNISQLQAICFITVIFQAAASPTLQAHSLKSPAPWRPR